MLTRRLDENGDIVTSGQQFITNLEAVAQTLETRLKLLSGEYFRDVNDGVDWFGQILAQKTTTVATIEAIIRQRILRTEYVSALRYFNTDIDLEKRTISITAEVLTDFGNVDLRFSTSDLL